MPLDQIGRTEVSRPRRARPKCPICGRSARAAHRPFCGPECREVDLGRWLAGVYVIPTEEPPEDDDAY